MLKKYNHFPSVEYALVPVFIMLLSCSEISSGWPLPCLLDKGLAPCPSIQGPPQCIPIHLSNILFYCSVYKFSQYFPKRPLASLLLAITPARNRLHRDAPLLSSHQTKPTFKVTDLSQTDDLITQGTSQKNRFPDSTPEAS